MFARKCLFGFATLVFAFCSLRVHAQPAKTGSSCPRPRAGSTVSDPPSLSSKHGILTVNLAYDRTTDADGRSLYCFVTADGLENPTLHVHPGDTLVINLSNHVPPGASNAVMQMAMNAAGACGPNTMMDASSVNLHYHGTNIAPVCHQDEVLTTIVNSGEKFQYRLKFPSDEPPGLYWYHAHIHGMAEGSVQGGASGALVVDGIENLQPEVAGLRERVLMIRDQTVAGNPNPGGPIPSWDLTLNSIPIAYPRATPAVLRMLPGEKQLWRVANASADSLVNLQVVYDGVPQALRVVGLDGVPTGSQDGTRKGKVVETDKVFIPTAGRAEFIVKAPSASVHSAVFRTLSVPTGPAGDNDTRRTLAKIELSKTAEKAEVMAAPSELPGPQRFEGLESATATKTRKLYFSEVISDPSNPASPTNFFITVDGAKPVLFSPVNPPAIVTTQGAVEEWTIENRAPENHEFHIHQIHFLLESRNGVPVPQAERQFLDTVQVPYWSGKGPYPSVTVRMDFRGPVVGDFVYHCHILGHEDNGMMAIIRVLPKEEAQHEEEMTQ